MICSMTEHVYLRKHYTRSLIIIVIHITNLAMEGHKMLYVGGTNIKKVVFELYTFNLL